MNFFYIEFDDGDFFTTGFNGSLEDAKKYYLGNSFERFDEKMRKCVKVEEAAREESKLKKKGICAHGWYNAKNVAKCNECGKVFTSETQLLGERARILGY